ncbi:MAG: hypothetical protein GX061_06480 [Eubacteriaceae bacterium]|nr:hypothetical protein [Eubacteriaceae bacterium]
MEDFRKKSIEDNKRDATEYKQGLTTLVIMAAISTLNVVLTLFKADFVFVFSAFTPYFLATVGYYLLNGTLGGAILIAAAFVICGLFFLFRIIAGKKPSFLIAGLILYILDYLFYLYNCFNEGFDTGYLKELLFGVFIIYSIGKALPAGRRLNAASREISLSHGMEPQEAFKSLLAVAPSPAQKVVGEPYRQSSEIGANPSDTADSQEAQTPQSKREMKILYYDKAYAKQNKAAIEGKITLLLILSCVVFPLVLLITTVFMVRGGVSGPILLGVFFGGLILCFVMTFKIAKDYSPFLEAKNTVYFLENGNTLIKKVKSGRTVRLNNLSLEEERENSFLVNYTDSRGKTVSMVIPRGYPGLGEFIK